MRSLLFLGGGLLIGVGISWGEATRRAEQSAKKRYSEQLATHKAVLQRSAERYIINQTFVAEKPAATEEELVDNSSKHIIEDDVITVGGEMTVASPEYVEAATQYSEQNIFHVDSAESIAYIEAEDYEEEDGRPKEQISIMLGGDEPLFLMDGQPVENWAELIGEQIIRDFYRLTPDARDRVLYVRNHKRDEDFEVILGMP
jgi:hypothetical protein